MVSSKLNTKTSPKLKVVEIPEPPAIIEEPKDSSVAKFTQPPEEKKSPKYHHTQTPSSSHHPSEDEAKDKVEAIIVPKGGHSRD